MKKKILILSLFLLVVLVAVLFLRKDEDSWICVDDSWVKHGNPTASQPLFGCDEDGISVATTQIYFPNKNTDPNFLDCSLVEGVSRQFDSSENLIENTLRELLVGPNAFEVQSGFFTSINSGVKILDLEISSSTIRVNFSSELENGVGGSCRVLSIRSQIENTLKQFNNINNVIIQVGGREEDVLQP